ncbi:MAG: TlpA family protein disulfide reductase, partial [Nitrosomonadales bacterium]|nr:TlpA family protein disulfide reductase [Nitrosomonadales bacterium]MBT7482892.1 TlpA family protein disulfide reductase [Nitrosomonadales bacterium]
LLINFWATWCAPCREEIPELNEFSHQNKHIQTIAIAIDDLESVNKFTKKIPIQYLSFIAENEGVELSQSLGNERGILPFSIIIGPDRKIEKIFYGRLKLNQLNQALNSIIR